MRAPLLDASFLTENGSDLLIAGLALLVLVEAVIIFIWARRNTVLRQSAAERERAAAVELATAVAAARAEGEAAATRTIYTVNRGARSRVTAAAATGQADTAAAATPAAEVQPVRQPDPPGAWAAPAEPSPAAEAAAPAATPPEPVARADNGGTAAALDPAPFASAEAPESTAAPALPWSPAPPAPRDDDGHTGNGSDATPAVAWALAEVENALPWRPAPAVEPATDTATPSPAPMAAAAAAPDEDGDDTSTIAPDLAGKEILLVEDDENIARLYSMLLESRGLRVRHASDGIEGLAYAGESHPDLVLLDVMMPRMNGIMFLEHLREDDSTRDIPVVVLSNFMEKRLVDRALALGALEYMVKAQTRPQALMRALPHWLRGERSVA